MMRSIVTIDRTHPILRPAPDPPAPLADEDWMTLDVRIAAFGSQEVLAALSEFSRRAREFHARAATWHAMAGQVGPAAQQVREAHEAMETARTQAREQSVTLQNVVRDELANL